jgi:hypothetical protein
MRRAGKDLSPADFTPPLAGLFFHKDEVDGSEKPISCQKDGDDKK